MVTTSTVQPDKLHSPGDKKRGGGLAGETCCLNPIHSPLHTTQMKANQEDMYSNQNNTRYMHNQRPMGNYAHVKSKAGKKMKNENEKPSPDVSTKNARVHMVTRRNEENTSERQSINDPPSSKHSEGKVLKVAHEPLTSQPSGRNVSRKRDRAAIMEQGQSRVKEGNKPI